MRYVDQQDSPNTLPYSWIMIFMGHSGSSALTEQFGSHPNVHITGYEPVDRGFSTANALNYTERVFYEARVQSARSVRRVAGFKMRPEHILAAPARWAELVHRHSTAIFWTDDANLLRSAINSLANIAIVRKLCATSIHVLAKLSIPQDMLLPCMQGRDARQDGSGSEGRRSRRYPTNTARASYLQFLATGSHRTEISALIAKVLPVTIDIASLAGEVLANAQSNRNIAAAVRALQGSAHDDTVLRVTYHDFLSNRNATVADMHRHVSVDPTLGRLNATALDFQPPTTAGSCVRISNWADVCQFFGACLQFAWMLDHSESNGCHCIHTGCRMRVPLFMPAPPPSPQLPPPRASARLRARPSTRVSTLISTLSQHLTFGR